jgi:hypothetical protein
MDTSEGPQKGPQRCPHTFAGVGMSFARAIAIGISCPFASRMTDGCMASFNRGVALIFIGIDVRAWPSELLDMCPQGGLLRIAHDPQAHLATHPPDRTQHGWTVVGIRAASTTFIRPTARWVAGVKMLLTFFPRRSGTFHRSQSRGRAGLFGVGWPALEPANDGAISRRFSLSSRVRVPDAHSLDLGRRHAAATPPGLAATDSLRTGFYCTAYRRLGSADSDRPPTHSHGWSETDAPRSRVSDSVDSRSRPDENVVRSTPRWRRCRVS